MKFNLELHLKFIQNYIINISDYECISIVIYNLVLEEINVLIY